MVEIKIRLGEKAIEQLDLSIAFESTVYEMIKKDNNKVLDGVYKFERTPEYNNARKDIDLSVQNIEIEKLTKQRLASLYQIKYLESKGV